MNASMYAVDTHVGAGVSHVRFQAAVQATRLTDQKQSSATGVKSAALDLINSAMATVSATTGHDLDVMA